MVSALDTVRTGNMSINQAAIHFHLPYSSLYGRINRYLAISSFSLKLDLNKVNMNTN